MKTPLTYPDGTQSQLGDLVEITTPRGDKSFGVVVENAEDGVYVVPVPRSSAVFVTTAKPAAQANKEAMARDEAAAEAEAARLKVIAVEATKAAEQAEKSLDRDAKPEPEAKKEAIAAEATRRTEKEEKSLAA